MRLVAPQDLTGSFRVQSEERGQFVNKAGGTAQHQFGERTVEYRFNEVHMRGPAMRGATHRVLLLGDSFTFGVLLEEPETYAARLDAAATEAFGADEVEVLNAGVPGFGLANYVAWIEEFGDTVRPSLVVVFFNGGDVHRSVVSGLYTLDGGRLVAHDLPKRRLKNAVNMVPGYQWLIEHSHLLQLLRRAMVRANPSRADDGPPPDDELDAAAALAHALVDRLADWCETRAVPLVVLTTGFQDSPHFGSRRYASLRYLETAPSQFAERGISYADLEPAVRAASPDLVDISIPVDEHPNERGAELIAELAWPHIKPQLLRLVDGE